MIAAFARCSRAEQALLASVALLFMITHLLLRFGSFQQARNTLLALARRLPIIARDVQELTWCIDRVHDWLPGHHSCLVNALVCDAVATASGIPVDLRLGAARSEAGHRFHAWIDYNGLTIIGFEHAGFAPFPNF